MHQEDDYIDQLFKDHFDDFSRSPADTVWDGIEAKATMANGKKLATQSFWKIGFISTLVLMFSFVMVSEFVLSKTPVEAAEGPMAYVPAEAPVEAYTGIHESPELQTPIATPSGQEEEIIEPQAPVTNQPAAKAQPGAFSNVFSSTATPTNAGVAQGSTQDYPHSFGIATATWMGLDELGINHTAGYYGDTEADNQLSKEERKDLWRSVNQGGYYKKNRGGHWFVSGGMAFYGTLNNPTSLADGLVFGAGKYLSENSFMEVNMRGIWGQGFNMRVTYNQLLLPGKLRPYVQVGLAWDSDLDIRAGLGLLYVPSPVSDWRFFISASYERGSRLFDGASTQSGVLEFGAQLKLNGTQPVLSNNKWMNSIPHYKLPRGWYVEGSTNWSFDEKTKVTRASLYAGKNINRRLYMRGGLRFGRENTALPVHLQYHVLVRQKLRFGAYAGPSLNVSELSLGAELGLVAYYEVLPGWSLYVAPVLLDNSSYQQRIFETGLRFYLPKK